MYLGRLVAEGRRWQRPGHFWRPVNGGERRPQDAVCPSPGGPRACPLLRKRVLDVYVGAACTGNMGAGARGGLGVSDGGKQLQGSRSWMGGTMGCSGAALSQKASEGRCPVQPPFPLPEVGLGWGPTLSSSRAGSASCQRHPLWSPSLVPTPVPGSRGHVGSLGLGTHLVQPGQALGRSNLCESNPNPQEVGVSLGWPLTPPPTGSRAFPPPKPRGIGSLHPITHQP